MLPCFRLQFPLAVGRNPDGTIVPTETFDLCIVQKYLLAKAARAKTWQRPCSSARAAARCAVVRAVSRWMFFLGVHYSCAAKPRELLGKRGEENPELVERRRLQALRCTFRGFPFSRSAELQPERECADCRPRDTCTPPPPVPAAAGWKFLFQLFLFQ